MNNTQSIDGEAKPRLLLFSSCNKRLFWESSARLVLQYHSQHESTTSLQNSSESFQCSAADRADHPVPRALLVLKFTEKGSLELED